MSAYSCAPDSGSEPGVGWRLASRVAETHEVWVVVHSEYERKIKDYLSRHAHPNLHIVFFDLPGGLEKLLRPPRSVQLHYYLWQRCLLRRVQELHRQVGFDIVQHTTFVRYWTPSPLGRLNLPFVWGPVGAGESTPRKLTQNLPLKARLHCLTRDVARSLAEYDPELRRTARAASVALATTAETAQRLRRLGAQTVELLPPVAFAREELSFFESLRPSSRRPFRAICMGRQVYWKGFHLALQGFAEFSRSKPDVELWILGDGPERHRLEKLSENFGVAERVKFLGRLRTNEETYDALAQAHVLLHPALFDGFPTVVIEAMAAGKPPICLDLSGPGQQVTTDTGIKVTAGPEAPERGIARALSDLYDHPEKLDQMGRAAQERARTEFGLENVVGRLLNLYQTLAPRRENGHFVRSSTSN